MVAGVVVPVAAGVVAAGVVAAGVVAAGAAGVVVTASAGAGLAGLAGAGFGWLLGLGGAEDARVCALGMVSVAWAQPLRRWLPTRSLAVNGVFTSPASQAAA